MIFNIDGDGMIMYHQRAWSKGDALELVDQRATCPTGVPPDSDGARAWFDCGCDAEQNSDSRTGS